MDPRSQLYGQIRTGRVSSVDTKRHTAQVQFEEMDGFVSFDLQVLVTRPGDYSLPSKDTPVLCLLIDGRLGAGFVLGAIYTESDAAPLDDAGQRSVVCDDLRLGTPDASDKVALAPKCKQNFDHLNNQLDKISSTLGSLTGGVAVAATFAIPYTKEFSVIDPAAEKVSAK